MLEVSVDFWELFDGLSDAAFDFPGFALGLCVLSANCLSLLLSGLAAVVLYRLCEFIYV